MVKMRYRILLFLEDVDGSGVFGVMREKFPYDYGLIPRISVQVKKNYGTSFKNEYILATRGVILKWFPGFYFRFPMI